MPDTAESPFWQTIFVVFPALTGFVGAALGTHLTGRQQRKQWATERTVARRDALLHAYAAWGAASLHMLRVYEVLLYDNLDRLHTAKHGGQKVSRDDRGFEKWTARHGELMDRLWETRCQVLINDADRSRVTRMEALFHRLLDVDIIPTEDDDGTPKLALLATLRKDIEAFLRSNALSANALEPRP